MATRTNRQPAFVVFLEGASGGPLSRSPLRCCESSLYGYPYSAFRRDLLARGEGVEHRVGETDSELSV